MHWLKTVFQRFSVTLGFSQECWEFITSQIITGDNNKLTMTVTKDGGQGLWVHS